MTSWNMFMVKYITCYVCFFLKKLPLMYYHYSCHEDFFSFSWKVTKQIIILLLPFVRFTQSGQAFPRYNPHLNFIAGISIILVPHFQAVP